VRGGGGRGGGGGGGAGKTATPLGLWAPHGKITAELADSHLHPGSHLGGSVPLRDTLKVDSGQTPRSYHGDD